MTIIVDCNNDRITIQKGIAKVEMPCKYPTQTIKIISELLNMLNIEGGIILDKIDEDYRITVEEW